ncbi:hypothetical protein CKQ90_32055, partial [Klebsiella pneumoniae]
LRLTTLLRISILSALSVAFVGPIGFIGLVAPHTQRVEADRPAVGRGPGHQLWH